MQKKSTLIALLFMAGTLPVFATEPATPPTEAPTPAATEAADQSLTIEKLGEGLIYSVNRTPQRPFETARGVQVITREDIWRKNATSLSDILTDEPGFMKYRSTSSTVTPVLRGLGGRQVLMMIDGIKVNDALSPEVFNMDLIDISQIERIEIVRGVVSVLGTESLGGVINIITKKGPPTGKTAGGMAGYQYSSGRNSSTVPLEAFGQNERLRWIAGIQSQTVGGVEGPKGVGEQRFTDYTQRSARAHLDYFLSKTKTLSLSYQASGQGDVKSAATLLAGTAIHSFTLPARLQLGSASYQDLTDHGWVGSIKASAYWNVQDFGTDVTAAKTPNLRQVARDTDRLFGANLEMASFFGESHHLVYGLDYTLDKVDSQARDTNTSTGVITWKRGHFTDESQYQTTGIYAQDNFDLTKWLTVTGGLRYGIFKTSGEETLPLIGPISLDSTNRGLTSSLNLVFHATPNVNLIANAMRGIRAANLRDISGFSQTATTVTIPSPGANPEKITSYELGAKYENTYVSGSAFLFRNSLSNLLFPANGTFKGLPFFDLNGDGIKQAAEPIIRSNQNIAETDMNGYEVDLRVTPRPWLTLFANYTRNDVKSPVGQESVILVRVPPPAGAAGVKVESRSSRWHPWGELVYSYTKEAFFNGALLAPKLGETRVAGGFTASGHLRFNLAAENLTDEKFVPRFTTLAYPGRRFTLNTQFRF